MLLRFENSYVVSNVDNKCISLKDSYWIIEISVCQYESEVIITPNDSQMKHLKLIYFTVVLFFSVYHYIPISLSFSQP
jgi:hypothetical protein